MSVKHQYSKCKHAIKGKVPLPVPKDLPQMNICKDPPAHHTNLFTIWEERSGGLAAEIIWCFRLEDPHTGKKYLFVSLAELVQFLEQHYCSPKP